MSFFTLVVNIVRLLGTTDSKSIVLLYRFDRILDLQKDFRPWRDGKTSYVEKIYYLVTDKNSSNQLTRSNIFFYIRGCTIISASTIFGKVENCVTSVE